MQSNTPATRLSSVQELLSTLDGMKNNGAKAHERLEFIIEKGAHFDEPFEIDYAFDLEAQVRNLRLKELLDLQAAMQNVSYRWNAAPFSDEIKEAASKLFAHQKGFIDDALKVERESESEMLSQLWPSDPDLSHLYPWLISWKPKEIRQQVLSEIFELANQKKELEKKVVLEKAARDELLEKKEVLEKTSQYLDSQESEKKKAVVDKLLETSETPIMDEAITTVEKTDGKEAPSRKSFFQHAKEPVKESTTKSPYELSLEKAEEKLRKREGARMGTPPLGERVSWDQVREKVVGRLGETVKEVPPTEVSALIKEAWASTLCEMTTDPWTFSKEQHGRMGYRGLNGVVLFWSAPDVWAQLDILEHTLENSLNTMKTITLELWVKGRFYKNSCSMSDDEIVKLHLAPLDFITKTLEHPADYPRSKMRD